MRVLEQSVIGKTGDAELCEDGIVVTSHFAAVIDGATDKTGLRFGEGGITGGRHAMLVVIDAIKELDPGADLADAVRALTRALADRLPRGLAVHQLPSAVATVYAAARHEVWQIGDVGFRFEGRPRTQPPKHVDEINVAMRVAVLRAELIRGVPLATLAATDPGREAITPLLERQALFANNPAAGPLAYPMLDSRPVPLELISTTAVPDGTRELVLASDGYPEILATLAETEARLAVLVAEDPLCIGPMAGTKAVKRGHSGYDDRAYLRLAL